MEQRGLERVERHPSSRLTDYRICNINTNILVEARISLLSDWTIPNPILQYRYPWVSMGILIWNPMESRRPLRGRRFVADEIGLLKNS